MILFPRVLLRPLLAFVSDDGYRDALRYIRIDPQTRLIEATDGHLAIRLTCYDTSLRPPHDLPRMHQPYFVEKADLVELLTWRDRWIWLGPGLCATPNKILESSHTMRYETRAADLKQHWPNFDLVFGKFKESMEPGHYNPRYLMQIAAFFVAAQATMVRVETRRMEAGQFTGRSGIRGDIIGRYDYRPKPWIEDVQILAMPMRP